MNGNSSRILRDSSRQMCSRSKSLPLSLGGIYGVWDEVVIYQYIWGWDSETSRALSQHMLSISCKSVWGTGFHTFLFSVSSPLPEQEPSLLFYTGKRRLSGSAPCRKPHTWPLAKLLLEPQSAWVQTLASVLAHRLPRSQWVCCPPGPWCLVLWQLAPLGRPLRTPLS